MKGNFAKEAQQLRLFLSRMGRRGDDGWPSEETKLHLELTLPTPKQPRANPSELGGANPCTMARSALVWWRIFCGTRLSAVKPNRAREHTVRCY